MGKDGETKVERENRKAPQTNPSRSGVRSGNPQLDPESARHEPASGEAEPRTPHLPPHRRGSPTH